MKSALLALSLTITATAPTPQVEPPTITLTEKQRMALVDTITRLKEEADEAEDRALFWYRQAQKCQKKTPI